MNLTFNLTNLNIEPKTLNNIECLDLCNQTRFNIFIEPFLLLGLSILFSWVAWYITENYEHLTNKYPKRINQLQKLYSICSWLSLIAQCSLALWVVYLINYGVN